MALPTFTVNYTAPRTSKPESKYLGSADVTISLAPGVDFVVRRVSIWDGRNGAWVKWPSESYEKDGERKSFSFIRFNEDDAPAAPPYMGSYQAAIVKAILEAVNSGESADDRPAAPATRGNSRGGGRGAAPRGRRQRAATSVDDEW